MKAKMTQLFTGKICNETKKSLTSFSKIAAREIWKNFI